MNATGLYGTNSPTSDEQRGLETFITLNTLATGSVSEFADKAEKPGTARYVNESAGFQVAAGSNTVRLIVSPRSTLTATTYRFVKCKMNVVFSGRRL